MPLDFQGPTDINFRKFEEAWLDTPVFQLFSQVVQRNPAHTAIKCGGQQLSYQEVYKQAVSLAMEVKAVNDTHAPVGIALPNDVSFPVAMLACLAIGCPYVPLDIDLPIARNQLIIEQSGIKTIITTTNISLFSEALHRVNIDDLTFNENHHPDFEPTPDDIAYIIYTSGSTGIPKGVYQNQRNLLHDVMQYTNSIHLNDNDRLTLLYSPGVNGAIRDIYGALLNGATLVIKNLKSTSLYDLSEFIRREGITIYHSIPNIFRTFLKLNPDKSDFSSVRLIYLAGDRIYNTDVDLYKAFFPAGCLMYVGIGATEVATIYRQWFINHTTLINQELIPLGYAVEDREMLLLDEKNEQVAEGTPGEICVKSRFVSLGYWKNPAQTAESFNENPENPAIRTYKTGDLGRINDRGLLEFIGRKDNQVKINGYRIELSEIEGALMNHPSIERCGVVLHTTDKHNALFAFYISNTEIPETRLKHWLGESLPNYMIPQRCIQVKEIPILHNFKNDNKALKKLAGKFANTGHENPELSVSGNDFLLLTLRRTWSKFLDEYSFDKNIRWKDAGGDSLNAVNFLVQLESDLGTTLPTDWIHGEMTPDEIYTYLNSLDIKENTNREQIIYVFPALPGMVENTRAFLKNLSLLATIRIINYPKWGDTPPDNRNLQYITAFILKQMPDYNSPNIGFLGICSGSLIMNHIISHKIPEHYSLIGIIESSAIYSAAPLYKNFFERATNFLKQGDLLNYSIKYLYDHFSYSKKVFHYLEKKNYYQPKKDHNRTIIWDVYQNLIPTYIDSELLYFGCDNSILDKDGEHWKPYFKKTIPIAMKGIHSDMLDAHNAGIVTETIKEIFARQEVSL